MDLVDCQFTCIYGKEDAQSYTKKVLDMCYDLVSQYQAIQSKEDDLDSSSDFSCVDEDANLLSDYDIIFQSKKVAEVGQARKQSWICIWMRKFYQEMLILICCLGGRQIHSNILH